MPEMNEMRDRVRVMVDETLAALPIDGLPLYEDQVVESRCFETSDGVYGVYAFEGPLPDGADPSAIVSAAVEQWDRAGIPHGSVFSDDLATEVFATIDDPASERAFKLSVSVALSSKSVHVGGSTPCVPGAVTE